MPRHRTVLGALVIAGVAAAAVLAQAPRRTLYVTVTNAAGTPVTDLTAEDFTVTEAGQAREVLQAGRAREPLSIALLVDDSAASASHMVDVRTALLGFVRKLYLDHEIALISYGDRPTIQTDYTHDLPKLNNAIQRLYARPQAGAYLLDALVEVSDGLRKREAAHGAIIIVGTVAIEFSNRLHTDVIASVSRSGAILYALQIDPVGQGNDLDTTRIEMRGALEGAAHSTGGVNQYLITSLGLSKPLLRIADELTSQYRLVYAGGAEPRTADVRVGVSRAGLKARATPALASGLESPGW